MRSNTLGRIDPNSLPEFDPAAHLNTSPESIAAYINEIVSFGDPGLLVEALGTVARARGMATIAKDSGLQRPALDKALRAGADPGFDATRRVLAAMGLSLVVVPSPASPGAVKAKKTGYQRVR